MRNAIYLDFLVVEAFWTLDFFFFFFLSVEASLSLDRYFFRYSFWLILVVAILETGVGF